MSYQRDFQNKLNVGVVGIGSHCYRNILPALHYLPVRLLAFCDVNLELAQRTAGEYGVSRCYASSTEMYCNEKLDAVILCVGSGQHPALACEAFAAGLHVWMEKPAAVRLSQVEEMLRKRGDRVAVVGFKKAFMPAVEKFREILAQEKHQPVRSILAQYPVVVPTDGPAILRDGRFTNWLGNGCHPLSFMIALGGPVDAVTVHHGRNDTSVVILEYVSGAIGTLHAVSGGSFQPHEIYTVYANDANLVLDNCLRITYQRGAKLEYDLSTSYAPPGFDQGAIVWEPQNTLSTLENVSLMTQGVYGSLRSFCDQAQGGPRRHDGSLEFARDVAVAYEAALLSEGKRIELREIFTEGDESVVIGGIA